MEVVRSQRWPRSDRPPADWACWRSDPTRLYTVGAEDEVMLVDPTDWSLAQASDRVLPALPEDFAAQVSPETHAAVVELVTGVHRDVFGVVTELGALRARLARELRAHGLAAASAGTHPAADWDRTEVSHAPRY